LNIIIIFPFGNLFITIILPVSRYSLIKKIKKYLLRYLYADISPSDVNMIFIYALVKTDRVKELNAEFDFNIFI
jgi:hypothetical protein